jgi:hypothetical protein
MKTNKAPRKTTVVTLKSFYVGGEIKNVEYKSTIKNVEEFFKNAIIDAKLSAKHSRGSIYIKRTKNTLYINYFDIPNSLLIDVTRIIV